MKTILTNDKQYRQDKWFPPWERGKAIIRCRELTNKGYSVVLMQDAIAKGLRVAFEINPNTRRPIRSNGKTNVSKIKSIRTPKIKQPKPPHLVKLHHAKRGSGITRRSDR